MTNFQARFDGLEAQTPDQAVMMVRENLEAIPDIPLPSGYSMRWFRSGDEDTWVNIQSVAEPYRGIYPQLFNEQFGINQEDLAERMLFLMNENNHPVATGAAWFDDYFGDQKYGRVHWLAVIPEEQGRGLGNALLGLVCRKLKELGCTKAFLRTSTARIIAIKLYLRFGFRPFIRNMNEETIWNHLLQTLQP